MKVGSVVDRSSETMERLLNRAGSLIDSAGGGDWNREDPDWQLAAAAWKRDLQAIHEPAPVFELEPGLPATSAVMRALGAASTCWANLRDAGEFDSTRAEQIGQVLLTHLRAYPADSSRELVSRAWHLLRKVPENAAGPEFEVAAHKLGADLSEHGWFLPPEQVEPEQVDVEQVYAGTLAATVEVDGREYPVEVGPAAVGVDLAGGAAENLCMIPDCVNEQQGWHTRHGSCQSRTDLGDDPDGDIEGYDGPMDKPGGYCQRREENEEPHLPGTKPRCPACFEWSTRGTP